VADGWQRAVPAARSEEGQLVARVAIVTDSASDLPPEVAAAAGITVVPLVVNFGSETFKAGVDLTTEQFWQRMVAPDSPFPTTAASAPGAFQQTYEAAFAGGADAVVSVHVADTLSGTIKAARIAAGMMDGREVHVVDSWSASMGVGLLAQMGANLAAQGVSAGEIARIVTDRAKDIDLYVALDTLEYLKRGGRISGARAAIGTLLSVKPIITVREGVVDTADRVRTRAKARDRVLELLTAKPLEQVAVLHTTNADVEEFTGRVKATSGLPDDAIQVMTVGASVGPHLGPGCVGGVVLYKR
jgi:DegV family protein with EDD domain